MRQRANINTTRKGPSLDLTHCRKLQDIHGDLGETTALDIGCGTGGSCFELALSFSHVLGLDGDPMHVVAAKEMKERGQLEYFPVAGDASSSASTAAAAAASSPAGRAARRLSEAGEELQQGATCAAKVSDDIDRDKVRFWQYALPELPPKLQPVDAVLVEDVEGRLGPGLARVLEQVPGLLKPEGVCVVVLDDSSSSSSSEGTGVGHAADVAAAAAGVGGAAGDADMDEQQQHGGSGFVASMRHVRQRLEQQGLRFVKQQQLRYPLAGGSCGLACAGVWLQS
ncbi:hypothetical protein OEZ86_005362 [Tetradesmus obliquus]|nr:hypothetical protein OEZ86_005362 [Tetradesmus obliquus]